MKLAERDAVVAKLFGTGSEEWHFGLVSRTLMPSMVGELNILRSAISNQIRRAESLQTNIFATFFCFCLAIAQFLSETVYAQFEKVLVREVSSESQTLQLILEALRQIERLLSFNATVN